MQIGYIVGIIVAVGIIICGCAEDVHAKKNQKNSKWAKWAIIFEIAALISSVINYCLFYKLMKLSL